MDLKEEMDGIARVIEEMSGYNNVLQRSLGHDEIDPRDASEVSVQLSKIEACAEELLRLIGPATVNLRRLRS